MGWGWWVESPASRGQGGSLPRKSSLKAWGGETRLAPTDGRRPGSGYRGQCLVTQVGPLEGCRPGPDGFLLSCPGRCSWSPPPAPPGHPSPRAVPVSPVAPAAEGTRAWTAETPPPCSPLFLSPGPALTSQNVHKEPRTHQRACGTARCFQGPHSASVRPGARNLMSLGLGFLG